MIRAETTGVLDEVDAEIEIDDDGMLTAAVHERDAKLTVRAPDRQPLSAAEEHAELSVTGTDGEVTLSLSGPQLDALADALYHAQEAPDGS